MQYLLVDLGHVICDFDHRRRLEVMSEKTGVSAPEIDSRIWDAGIDALADAGELSLSELTNQVNTELDSDMTEKEICEIWCTAFKPNQKLIDYLQTLTELDHMLSIVLLTDNSIAVALGLESILHGALSIFDHKLYSYELGQKKTDGGILLALERLGAFPENSMLIDDNPRVIEAARSLDVQTFLFSKKSEIVQLKSTVSRWLNNTSGTKSMPQSDISEPN